MICISGLGFALPETVIDGDFLGTLDPSGALARAADDLGISSRRTTLPLSYLKDTGNRDVSKALKAATESPTDMGARAARMPLERAGVDAAEVGLLVASCITPWQTIPSEAARIAQRLGVKVPVYDISGTGAELPFLINLINSWKEDRVPEHVLFVATHAPTQRVVYDGRLEGALFGDAAGAVLISSRARQGLRMTKVFYAKQRPLAVHMRIFESLSVDLSQVIDGMMGAAAALLDKCSGGETQQRFILTQAAPRILDNMVQPHHKLPDAFWYPSRNYGYSCGAAAIVAMAERCNELGHGERVLVSEVGLGGGYGYVELEQCCTYLG